MVSKKGCGEAGNEIRDAIYLVPLSPKGVHFTLGQDWFFEEISVKKAKNSISELLQTSLDAGDFGVCRFHLQHLPPIIPFS